MKYILLFCTFCFYLNLEGQSWYSKLYNPFGQQEVAKAITLVGDTAFIRANNMCSNNIICSVLGIYSLSQRNFLKIEKFENVQGGTKNLMLCPDHILLSSQESEFNLNISLNIFDKATLEFIDSIRLQIDSSNYFSYTISTSSLYRDKIILSGSVLDSLNFIGYPGWNNYQEKSFLFVLNKDYSLDTILIIPPSSGAFIKVEDIAEGPDSILYISFYEKYLKQGPSNDYLEIRKVIYGFDEMFTKVFQWTGPDFDSQESISCLVVGKDSTIYINYKRNYKSFIAALRSDGSTKWECLLDPLIGSSLYSVRRLIQTENADIVGIGVISSVEEELGESGLIFRVDSTGKLLWKKAIRINKGFDLSLPFEFPFQSGFEDVLELPNGDLIISGYVRKYIGDGHQNGQYNFDIWMVQTNSEGCLWEDCPFIQDIVSKDWYIPIVYPGNEWVVNAHYDSLPSSIQRYSFSLDSILFNEEYYYELIYKKTINGPWEETGRFMREEEGKVFEYDPINFVETLLYNFHFQIGDSLMSHPQGLINKRKVIDVGSIKLADDVLRKTITIECTENGLPLDTTFWIEGIGDAERLFWTKTFCSTTNSDSILEIRCFLTDDQALYSRLEMEDCYITSVEYEGLDEMNIYPNPSYNIINFDLDFDQIATKIFLFNSIGQLIHFDVLPFGSQTLDVSNIPAGLYFGQIVFKNNSSKMFRVTIVN